MHKPIIVEEKTLDELYLIKEDYRVLKEEIEKLYQTLVSLETIREHDLSSDDEIEEI